jgi:hypothetical protein
LTNPAYATCRCAECQRLDRLPVRLHGIPHAVQPNFLAPVPASEWRPPVPEPMPEPVAVTCDDLPLFAGSLAPVLL